MKRVRPNELTEDTVFNTKIRVVCYVLFTFVFALIPVWLHMLSGSDTRVVVFTFGFILISYTCGVLGAYRLLKSEEILNTSNTNTDIYKRL
jgi:hydrogenase-4 membrane subunit HyfE